PLLQSLLPLQGSPILRSWAPLQMPLRQLPLVQSVSTWQTPPGGAMLGRQTPLTQVPLGHWLFDWQPASTPSGPPSLRGTQVLFKQRAVAEQSLSVEQWLLGTSPVG